MYDAGRDALADQEALVVAQPGHMLGTMAQTTMAMPSGRHSRWKPVIAVSPVASA